MNTLHDLLLAERVRAMIVGEMQWQCGSQPSFDRVLGRTVEVADAVERAARAVKQEMARRHRAAAAALAQPQAAQPGGLAEPEGVVTA